MREKNNNKNNNEKKAKKNKKNNKELEKEIEEVINKKEDKSNSVNKKGDNVEIDSEKLDIIEEEIKDNKEKFKNKAKSKNEIVDSIKENPKHKMLFKNSIIVIFYIIYFGLLVLGKDRIPTIEYIRDLRIIILLDVIISIVLLEVSLKKDNGDIFIYGIEMAFVGGFTLFILEFFARQDVNLNIWISVIVGFIVFYYIIKCLVLSKKKKTNN